MDLPMIHIDLNADVIVAEECSWARPGTGTVVYVYPGVQLHCGRVLCAFPGLDRRSVWDSAVCSGECVYFVYEGVGDYVWEPGGRTVVGKW